jgi:DnaK suppressor protein
MATGKKASRKKTLKKPAKKKSSAAKPAPKKVAKRAAKKVAQKNTLRKKPATPVEIQPKPTKMSAEVRKRSELLKSILLKKRNEVVNGLETQMGRRLTRETGQKIDSAMDSADQSAADVDQGIDSSLLEMRYEQYKDIADAFRKFQSETYGLCEECGNEISVKRLEVNPLARYCIECKTRKEEIEKIQREETRFKE